MARFLILRLDGPMQAWGTHTYEDFRPSNLFPTRSGLLGLLGACLGIERRDSAELKRLASSVEFAVRADGAAERPNQRVAKKRGVKLPDFHTVLDARKVDGSANRNPVVSHREYLFDAAFTVAVKEKDGAPIALARIAAALRQPAFTPVLGRRSCPIARPLLEGDIFEAADAIAALAKFNPTDGPMYVEGCASEQSIQIRDVPDYGRKRQFGTRRLYLHKEGGTCT